LLRSQLLGEILGTQHHAHPDSTAAVLHHPGALTQGDHCFWPTLARLPIRRPPNKEVLQAGEVLKDVLAVVSPYVDPVDKACSGSTLVVSQRRGSWSVCGCVDALVMISNFRIQCRGGR